MAKKKLSEEHKRKIGEATKRMWEEGVFDDPKIREAYRQQGLSTKGSKRTEEQKELMSEIQKELWSDSDYKERMSEIHKKRWTDEEKKKQSERMKKMHKNHPEIRKKISKAIKGREVTEKHREHLSEALKNHESLVGESSRWWRGGVWDNPYPPEFTPYLKKKIKKRDNYECQSCGQNVYGSKHGHVHHIDGDKQNCDEENLVLICATCHNAIHGKNNITSEKIEEYKGLLK